MKTLLEKVLKQKNLSNEMRKKLTKLAGSIKERELSDFLGRLKDNQNVMIVVK